MLTLTFEVVHDETSFAKGHSDDATNDCET